MEPGGSLACPAGVWDPAPALPCPRAQDPKNVSEEKVLAEGKRPCLV